MEKVTTKTPERPERKPVAARQRLNFVNTDPNRQYRIIDADDARLAQFTDAGYRIEDIKKHVLGGQRTDVPAPTDNTISVGGGKKQMLVSIEKEFYEEDQEKKQQVVNDREAAMKPNASEGQYGDVKISGELRRRS